MVGTAVVITVVVSGTFVVLTLTVDVRVVVSTLQLLFNITSILLNTVLDLVVNSVVVVVTGVVGIGDVAVVVDLIGIEEM